MRFITGNAQAILFARLPAETVHGISYNQQAVERLRAALRAGDAARVSGALREITETMRSMNVSLFAFRCMYHDILKVVSGEARDSGVEDEEIYDLFQLSQCLSWDELDGMLHHVCSRLVAGRGIEPAAPPVEGPVAQAKEIIARRFSEPGLSVASIAAEMGMSDSRLSVDFKKAYHMTPLECITHERMHLARRLLRETNMPVKDIAMECGYYDISGFNAASRPIRA